MTNALAYLCDRADPRVVAARSRTCSICKAPPGQDCRNFWKGARPLNRVVHLCRAQQHLDSR